MFHVVKVVYDCENSYKKLPLIQNEVSVHQKTPYLDMFHVVKVVYDCENSYKKLPLIQNEVSVHQKHIHALVMEVFNSLNNVNPEYKWSYFTFKHVTINIRNGAVLKLPRTHSTSWVLTSPFSEHVYYGTDSST